MGGVLTIFESSQRRGPKVLQYQLLDASCNTNIWIWRRIWSFFLVFCAALARTFGGSYSCPHPCPLTPVFLFSYTGPPSLPPFTSPYLGPPNRNTQANALATPGANYPLMSERVSLSMSLSLSFSFSLSLSLSLSSLHPFLSLTIIYVSICLSLSLSLSMFLFLSVYVDLNSILFLLFSLWLYIYIYIFFSEAAAASSACNFSSKVLRRHSSLGRFEPKWWHTHFVYKVILEAQQRYFPYRAILSAIVSQNSFLFLFSRGVARVSRDVLQKEVSHWCVCVKQGTKGYCTLLGACSAMLGWLRKYRAIAYYSL